MEICKPRELRLLRGWRLHVRFEGNDMAKPSGIFVVVVAGMVMVVEVAIS